ncbi:hypothetical protein VNO77_27216 [Canavalia gladiata]|uniref:Uncharacterized protein n=1 Tax=Canavalia gladiata TaxID=3824 RepID=A0AAN9KVD4_CANGL
MTDLGIADQDRHTNFGITMSQELLAEASTLIYLVHQLAKIDPKQNEDPWSGSYFVLFPFGILTLNVSLVCLRSLKAYLTITEFGNRLVRGQDQIRSLGSNLLAGNSPRANTGYPSCLIHLNPNVTGLMDVKSRTLRDCVHTPIAEPDPIQQGFSACLWCFPPDKNRTDEHIWIRILKVELCDSYDNLECWGELVQLQLVQRSEARTKTAPGRSVNIYLIRFIRLPHVLVPSLILTSQVMDALLILAGFPTVKRLKLTSMNVVNQDRNYREIRANTLNTTNHVEASRVQETKSQGFGREFLREERESEKKLRASLRTRANGEPKPANLLKLRAGLRLMGAPKSL